MKFQYFTIVFLLSSSYAPPSSPDTTDHSCLRGLTQVLFDPKKRLQNWTEPLLATACDGFNPVLMGTTCNNGRIFKLSLTGLELQGTISPFISNCTYLQSLDLSCNLLSGPIPGDLHLLLNLAVLNLFGNSLSGVIPPELSLCPYLNVIDLHSNRLSGEIPAQLGLLSRLSVLDLSGNRLSGRIPASVADMFNASCFEGNSRLYGYPLAAAGGGGGLTPWSIAGIGLGSGLTSLVLSFTAVCTWLRARKDVGDDEEEDEDGAVEDGRFRRSH